ncbi:MAG: GNAT family N-acetyltransferase [Planctomycetota bacterium]|jgi:RimJ/RimL family protein N-acetyltransferase
MQLKPFSSADIDLVAGWMAEEENYRWLDFGAGQQVLTAASLALMRQRNLHEFRLFTSDEEDEPIGLVALSNVSRTFKTASVWYVLGDKRHGGRGYTSRAVAAMLDIGFDDLGLESIEAWALADNPASVRVLEKNGLRPIGRRRRCHLLDGRPCDRLLFDIVRADRAGG